MSGSSTWNLYCDCFQGSWHSRRGSFRVSGDRLSARITAVIHVECRAVHVFGAGAPEPKDGCSDFLGLADSPGVDCADYLIRTRLGSWSCMCVCGPGASAFH